MSYFNYIVDKYKRGSKISGIVEYRAPFGVFINIGETVAKGLVLVTDFMEEGKYNEKKVPQINDSVIGTVLDVTETGGCIQVRLTIYNTANEFQD